MNVTLNDKEIEAIHFALCYGAEENMEHILHSGGVINMSLGELEDIAGTMNLLCKFEKIAFKKDV